MRRLLVLLGVLFAGALLFAGPASAHASVVTSSPRDGSRLQNVPKTVSVTFDENVTLGSSGYLHVTDQTGRRVDAGNAYHPSGDGTKIADDLTRGLGDGSYTASFRVISADSHPVAGIIRFVVGNGPLVRGSVGGGGATVNGAVSKAFDVSRWISYAGLAALGGTWLLATIWPAGRDNRRARRLVWGGWAALSLGALLELLLQGPYTAGTGLATIRSWSLLDDTLHTAYGHLHSARLVLLGVLAVVLARMLEPESRRTRFVTAALGLAIVWTFSDAGHGATTKPAWFSVSADMLHVIAMATWVGGLVMLTVAVLPRRDRDELRDVLPVFSKVAIVAVSALVASGTYAALRGIGTVDAVFHTTYGWVVVGKVLLLATIIAVANLSRRLVSQRAVAYAMSDALVVDDPELADDAVATERLRRSVLVEAGIALVVLGFSAVLVAQPRGKEALLASYREPVSATAPLAAGRSVEITAAPGTHGPISFTFALSDGRSPKSITATATQHDAEIGPLPIKLVREGAGLYDGSATLPVAGTWEIDLVVTSSTFDATTTDTTIRLH